MDSLDQTQEREDKLMSLRITHRASTDHMKGPMTCRCKGPNDRVNDGYAICSACLEESQDIALSNK